MNEMHTDLGQVFNETTMENDGWKVIDPLEINQEITSYKRKEEFKNELNILLEEANSSELDVDDKDGWSVLNFTDQHKLLLYAKEHRNIEENQNQEYSNFVSNWNNFVNADSNNRIRHHLPVIAKSFWNLFLSFENELAEYSEITNYAVKLIQQFILIFESAKNEIDVVNLEDHFKTLKNADFDILALSAAEQNEQNLALEKISSETLKITNSFESIKKACHELESKIDVLLKVIEDKIDIKTTAGQLNASSGVFNAVNYRALDFLNLMIEKVFKLNSDNKIFAEFLNKYIKDFKISSNKIEFLTSQQNDNIKQSNSFASIQFENYQKSIESFNTTLMNCSNELNKMPNEIWTFDANLKAESGILMLRQSMNSK